MYMFLRHRFSRFNLKTGDILVGNIRIKTQNEKYSALLYVQSVNGYKPFDAAKRKNFEDLTPIFPNERISLETKMHRFPCVWIDLLLRSERDSEE